MDLLYSSQLFSWMVPAMVLSSSFSMPYFLYWWHRTSVGSQMSEVNQWVAVPHCFYNSEDLVQTLWLGQCFCVSDHRTKSRKVRIIWFGGCNLATQLLHSTLFVLLHGMFTWKNIVLEKNGLKALGIVSLSILYVIKGLTGQHCLYSLSARAGVSTWVGLYV